jgi:hypothetical protein
VVRRQKDKFAFIHVQTDRNVTQPIPDTRSICQKINYIKIRKQKKKVKLSVRNVHSVTKFDYIVQTRHLAPKVDRNGFCPARFLCHGNGSPDEILLICLAQENREMYP